MDIVSNSVMDGESFVAVGGVTYDYCIPCTEEDKQKLAMIINILVTIYVSLLLMKQDIRIWIC